MFKLKLLKSNNCDEDYFIDYKGMEALDIPKGGIVEVLGGSVANEGDILIKTNDKLRPFVTINVERASLSEIGSLWYNAIQDYLFRYYPKRNTTNALIP